MYRVEGLRFTVHTVGFRAWGGVESWVRQLVRRVVSTKAGECNIERNRFQRRQSGAKGIIFLIDIQESGFFG